MPSLFRRKPADVAIKEDLVVDESDNTRRKGYTPSKRELGLVTPKRKAGGRSAEPPPANRREAVRRMRQKQRESRAEARAGMMAGKEEYLLPRDRGPERALVRDIVDSRRNLASYFLPGAVIVVVGGMVPIVTIQMAANMLWIVLALVVIVDSVLLSRRIRTAMQAKFPRSEIKPRSLFFYGVMRSLSFRRIRVPAPRVKPGDQI